jgi:iron(III) transport system permease protein
VWVLVAVFLAFLMLLPLGWLVALSFSGDGGAGLSSYRAALTDPQLRRALWNTVVLAFWVGLFSLAIGAPMAWLTARTDLPGKRTVRALMLASFVTPPFLGAFAWVMLAGPNAGALNKLYRELTGAEGPLVNIFSMPGLIFAVTLYTFPYVFIMIANTLELIASDLEEAAAILGARRIVVALTVTLPMVAPAIASGFILAVLQALALFGSPAILALPAGFHTITTQIWSYFQYPPKVELAAAASMPLLVATALLLYLQKRLLGRRRGYASVGGKTGQRRGIALGAWRWPALLGCLAVMACSIFLPRRLQRLSRSLGPADAGTTSRSATVVHVLAVQRDPVGDVNTLETGVMTATVGAVMATLSPTPSIAAWCRLPVPPFLVLAPVVIRAWCWLACSSPTRGPPLRSTARSGSCSPRT